MKIWQTMLMTAVVGIVTGIVSGCAGVPSEIESLDKTLKAYERTLRWASMDQANLYLKDKVTFSERERKRLKGIQVTGYRIITSEASTKKASQVVEIRYFNELYAVERTITDQQKWEYDEEEERWYLVSRLPRFK